MKRTHKRQTLTYYVTQYREDNDNINNHMLSMHWPAKHNHNHTEWQLLYDINNIPNQNKNVSACMEYE